MTRRIPELDGIRGLAILLVLVWHYFNVPMPFAFVHRAILMTWSGVDLFFVLSGFLIGGILIDARGSENYFKTFYVRRAFRILPSYFLLLLIVARIMGKHAYQIIPYVFFLQNFLMARTHSWGFEELNATWSLAVEEQFYLTLPLLIWIARPKSLWKIIAGLALAVPIFRSALCALFYPNFEMGAYVLLPCRAESLLLGVLIAIGFRNADVREWMQRRRWLFFSLIVVSAGPIIFCWSPERGVLQRDMSLLGYSAIAVFYASLLVLTLTSHGRLQAIFSWGWLRWMGTIAYAIYLIHMLTMNSMFNLIKHQRPQLLSPTDLVPWLAALTGTLLFAHLSWKLFEAPLVKIGHRFQYGERGTLRVSEEADNRTQICEMG